MLKPSRRSPLVYLLVRFMIATMTMMNKKKRIKKIMRTMTKINSFLA